MSDPSSLPSGYVPQLLPGDADGFAGTPGWEWAMVAAPQVVNPGTRAFVDGVRERTRQLLVDPRTAAYQFEGYMSMEEARAVPYSPGRGTLGSLWQPRDFAGRDARVSLTEAVLGLQERAGAALPLAPYFAVPRADHGWMEVAVECAAETLAAVPGKRVGIVVQIELDGLLGGGVEDVLAAWSDLDPALWVVVVTEFDERLASPGETRAVLDLIRGLAAAGAAVLPAYTGRFGLAALAFGASGLAGGALELEAHPRRYLREGLVNLKAHAHYLPGAMIRLPVREAAAVLDAAPEAGGVVGSPPPTRLVQRRRVQAALEAKRQEAEALVSVVDREKALRERLLAALAICREAAVILRDSDLPLRSGAYHYLEVLAEMVGGPAASLPEDSGF